MMTSSNLRYWPWQKDLLRHLHTHNIEEVLPCELQVKRSLAAAKDNTGSVNSRSAQSSPQTIEQVGIPTGTDCA